MTSLLSNVIKMCNFILFIDMRCSHTPEHLVE